MIHVDIPAHRARLARSCEFWHRHFDMFRQSRRELLILHAASPQWAQELGVTGPSSPQWMPMIQLAARAHVISTAYGTPEFTCIPVVPEADHIAPRLEEFLNRYTELMNLRRLVQMCSLDSFYGYGIARVDNGWLPPAIRHRVRLPFGADPVGPTAKRISQDHYGFDGSATQVEDIGFEFDLQLVPLDAARSFGPFLEQNPEAAAALEEYGYGGERTSGHFDERHGSDRQPMAVTRLINVWLPHAGVRAVWPAPDDSFGSVANAPLLVTEWKGHHSGPYAVLNHLDIPDNLLPIPRIESTKNLHYLVNELAEKNALAARKAQYNPTYETGNNPDAERIKRSCDRDWVGVSNLQKLGQHVIPGPDQSVTTYQEAARLMFKEVTGLDAKLGLAPTDDTATGQNLIASRVSADMAEDQERTHHFVEMIAVKLAHLALNDDQITFPMRRPLPKSSLLQDVSWLPRSVMPRSTVTDHYAIKIVPAAMRYRSPEQRVQNLTQAISELAQMAQVAQLGLPVDLIEVVDTISRYRHLPELRKWLSEILPEFAERKEQATMALRRAGVGQYTRTNVSSRTTAGAISQAMTQQPQQVPQAGAGPVGQP